MGSQGEVLSADLHKATFAGGCFWCMQPPFAQLEGVVSTTVGYTGGDKPDPTYEEVSSGTTGHVEAIQVVYDPNKVSYDVLLGLFWRSIDPTDPRGQFADQGSQYRTAIFYQDEEQRRLAEESKKLLTGSGRFRKPIATAILPAKPFYPAEEYHQQYYRTHSIQYKLYKKGSGREDFLEKTWGR
ncbi:MAG: peptide-methionine (S)-S-oxide reductase MsrA [Candidatus Omnitrophica bacterium]|nr:peptide-methionine (S)-S-oxide reductase MsrA [Candidatus Omnitrophota bacterium]MBF0569578.1 peptide-methionine (S)-S-oxide reductase MsrA [Candidatus Omnitrophota bacterium]